MTTLNFKKLLRSFLPSGMLNLIRQIYRTSIINRIARQRIETYLKIAKKKHEKNNEYFSSIIQMLVHVIDKGIHCADWEPGHSSVIYSKAIKLLDRNPNIDKSIKQWVESVLNEYANLQNYNHQQSDIRKTEQLISKISHDDLLQCMQMRTSCRQLKTTAVSTEIINLISMAALEAPCSSNRQTLKIYCTSDPDKALKGLSFFNGFTCFSKCIPCMFVFCADLRSYNMPYELFNPALDTGLAIQNALLMAHTLGLSMTLLTWGSHTKEQNTNLRAFFEIPEYYEIIAGATCGYPLYVPDRPVRKQLTNALILK